MSAKSQRRGVSHTPENIYVDKRVHSGVCDTPLQVIWWNADIHLKKHQTNHFP